jgi:hypothetical protein
MALETATVHRPVQPFQDPDPFHELRFANGIKARLAIADHLGQPLARLTPAQKDWIDALLDETLEKQTVMQRVRGYFGSDPVMEEAHVT